MIPVLVAVAKLAVAVASTYTAAKGLGNAINGNNTPKK